MSGQYWDRAFNAVFGCSPASPGCINCYAKAMHDRFGKGNFAEVRTLPERLAAPLHMRKGRVIFVCNTSDLFHADVPNEFIAAVFGVMAACPQHQFLVLTKRAERMAEWYEWIASQARSHAIADPDSAWWPVLECAKHAPFGGNSSCRAPFAGQSWPLNNVWAGTTVEDADHLSRMDILRTIPAAHRWVSFEPLLGPVEVRDWSGIDWAVIGCESGAKRRECKTEWWLSLVKSAEAWFVPA